MNREMSRKIRVNYSSDRADRFDHSLSMSFMLTEAETENSIGRAEGRHTSLFGNCLGQKNMNEETCISSGRPLKSMSWCGCRTQHQ